MMNTKKAFVSLVFLLFANFLFAEFVNFFTPKMNWFVENGFSLQNGADFKANTIVMDFYNELNMKELICSSGIENSQEGFHFTTDVIYWPTFFKYFNLGLGSTFHLFQREGEFVELDFLHGIFFRYSNLNWIEVQLNCSYFEKYAKIYAIQDSEPWLKNNNLAVSLKTEIFPIKRLKIFMEFASYSYYRYMLWFAPNFRFGANFRVNSLLNMGAEVEFQYIDMFTLSANCNSIDIRGFTRFNF